MKKKNVCILVLLAALFAACSDSDIVIDPTDLPPSETQKILVLCEGIWNHDNSTLAFYDLKSKTTDLDYFTTVNKRGLGDTANDMIKYGSKIYIVVNESGTIEVIDAATGKSLQQIEMKEKTTEGKEINKQPRYAAAYGGESICHFIRQYRDPHRYRFAGNRRLGGRWAQSGRHLHQKRQNLCGQLRWTGFPGLRPHGFGDRSEELRRNKTNRGRPQSLSGVCRQPRRCVCKRSRKLYRYRPEFQKNKPIVRSIRDCQPDGFGIYDRQRQSIHPVQRMGKRKRSESV